MTDIFSYSNPKNEIKFKDNESRSKKPKVYENALYRVFINFFIFLLQILNFIDHHFSYLALALKHLLKT